MEEGSRENNAPWTSIHRYAFKYSKVLFNRVVILSKCALLKVMPLQKNKQKNTQSTIGRYWTIPHNLKFKITIVAQWCLSRQRSVRRRVFLCSVTWTLRRMNQNIVMYNIETRTCQRRAYRRRRTAFSINGEARATMTDCALHAKIRTQVAAY